MSNYKRVIIAILVIGSLQVTVMPMAENAIADSSAMNQSNLHNTRMCVALGECK